MCLGEAVDNYMSGANRNAGLATRTLGVVEHRQVIHHGNSAVGALLSARSTADTADLAGVHNLFTLAFGRASNVNGGGGGYPFYYMFRTSRNTTAATYAYVGVNF